MSHYSYFLVRHRYGLSAAEVTAQFSRQTTDLNVELAERHRRLDTAVCWVSELASQL